MKSLLKSATLIFVNVLVTFLVSEVALRCWLSWHEESKKDFDSKIAQSASSPEKTILTGPVTMGRLIRKSQDKNRVYELIPNLEATFLGKQLSTNSFGIRDKEYSLEKPAKTVRVVGLGDSVMFGWGVDESESYLSIAERELNSSHSKSSPVEVLNFAVPGYNTTMEAASFAGLAKKFRPDIVVLHFVSNDFGVPLFMQTPQNYWTWKRSFLWEKLVEVLKQKENRGLVGIEAMGSENNQKQKVIKQYQHMLGHDGFRRAMRTISDASKEVGARVIILTGKLSKQNRALLEKKVLHTYGFELLEANSVVEDYMQKNSVPNTLAARKKLLWLNDKDSHPSVLGHRLYADALLERLRPLVEEVSQKH